MIPVRCGSCETIFEVRDESSGHDEICPACGVVNEIPIDSIDDPPPAPPPETGGAPIASINPGSFSAPAPRGWPSVLWWSLASIAIAVFILGLYAVFSDDWERQHVQFLVDTAQQADLLMNAGDYDAAGREYQLVLATVGDRNIHSVYLRGLIDHSRAAEREAELKFRQIALAATMPSPMDAAATDAAATDAPTTGPASTQLGSDRNPNQTPDQHYDAIREFQRASEGLGDFVSSRPVLFQDDRQRWRRRQFLAWDVTYQISRQSGSPEISMQLSVNSRTTDPHDLADDAKKDTSFLHDEFVGSVPIQTNLILRQGRWIITDQKINDNKPIQSVQDGMIRPGDARVLDDFFKIEADAFDSNSNPKIGR